MFSKKRLFFVIIGAILFLQLGTANALNINTSVNSTDMVNALLGTGITLVPGSISDGGAGTSGALFSGGTASGIGIDSGIVMTTGLAANADGPNTTPTESLSVGNTFGDTSTNNFLPGDAQLTALAGYQTFDANLLNFQFETATGDLYFRFVFASEEYIDYVNTKFNDVFGFYVDGVNIAVVPGTNTPISVNTINPNLNSGLYINNVANTNGYSVAGADTAYDGFTTVLTAQILGIGEGIHGMKLAIADAGDGILDAAVFIEAGSFSGYKPPAVPEPATMLLLASGLVGLAGFRRRFRK